MAWEEVEGRIVERGYKENERRNERREKGHVGKGERKQERERLVKRNRRYRPVSYTHLTLPTIYSV